jgi:hypothetical protein
VDSPPPPHSEARMLRPVASLALRAYDGDARLDRVWNRLSRRRERKRPGLVIFAVAGLSLSIGFFGGRFSNHGEVSESHSPLLGPAPTAESVHEVPASRAAEPARAPATARGEPRRDLPASPLHRVQGVQRRGLVPEPEPTVEQVLVEEAVETASLLPKPELRVPERSWVLLAERGDYSGAFRELDETGELPRVVASGSPEELMTLAEVARFAGRNAWAIQALREVTTRYEADENAPIAAMMLGNLLNRAGDAEGAARAFALNRRLSPQGDFAEDALVREFGVATKAGERERALVLLAEFEREFPHSERLEPMREALAALEVAAPEDKTKSEDGAEDDTLGDQEGSVPSGSK